MTLQIDIQGKMITLKIFNLVAAITMLIYNINSNFTKYTEIRHGVGDKPMSCKPGCDDTLSHSQVF